MYNVTLRMYAQDMSEKRQKIEVSALRRDLFEVLDQLAEGTSFEITRRGHVVATLAAKSAPSTKKPQVNFRRLARLCQKHRVRRLALFGSVLRDDFRADSDVDALIDPEPGSIRTIGELVRLRKSLERAFGRRVDLLTRSSVEKHYNAIRRHEILSTAKVIYEARH